MKKRIILPLLLIINTILHAQSGLLQLEDIWASPKFFARTASGFSAMKDGEHYTDMDNNSIIRYAFRSGKAVDTLLKSSELISGSDTVDFTEYSFSEDEQKILLTSNPEQIYRHSMRADYYVFDRASRRLTRITTNGKSMYGSFSPSADKVAYVRDNNLYLFDLNTGSETAITTDGKKNEIINGATDWVYEEEFSMDVAFAWSPDGKHIAYYRFDESRVKEFNLTYYGELYPKEERYKYPKAGEENSKVAIYCYDIAGKRSKMLIETGKDWEYIPRIKWTRDADLLAIQRNNRTQNILEMLFCRISSGENSVVLKEQNNTFIEITDDLTFLADGKRFIWSSSRDGFNHIYLYTMQGNLIKQVTKGEYDVTSYYGYDEKKDIFYYQSSERSPMERQIYAISSAGKKQILTPESGVHNAEFSEGLRYFVDTYSSFGKPFTCVLRTAAGKEIRVLENNEGVRENLKSFSLGILDTFSILNDENIRLYGWMIRPPDFNPTKTYPVLMHVYGGPGAQTVTNDWDGPNYMWHQYLAQRGYLIVSVDNRGTPGRGLAFANAIHRNMGDLEVRDQLSVAKYLKTLPYVDGNRLGIWGWSFGGYMTSLLMTKGNGQFKAGIAVAPVTTWRYYDSIYTERYLQTPQENPKGYDNNSPINFAKGLQGKFMLVHGSTDDNVHMQNTMDFVTALVKANKQFDLFIYPNKNHGIGGGNTRLHLYNRMTRFVMDNL